ncbi:MAG TPA: hypothetical protein VGD45_20715 [Steroidobacter sp.]|uniref:hypothetical protein n=1 Tax=Steroidobacter sp. TaxID=1978227 RepID=UPI002ED89FA7
MSDLVDIHFYDEITGIFTGSTITVSTPSVVRMVAANTQPGQRAFVGQADPLSQRVDPQTGDLVDYQPPAPDDDHEWVIEDEHGNRRHRWVLKAEAVERQTRKAAATARIAELGRKTERATREFLLGIVPTEEDRAAGAMTLEEIENELATLRLEV